MTAKNTELSATEKQELLGTLKTRFEKNMNRHAGLDWAKVQSKLEASAEKLWSSEMERTGGEPDVIGRMRKRANSFSMIVPRKHPRTAGTCVTTGLLWKQGRNSNPGIPPWMWLPLWVLRS